MKKIEKTEILWEDKKSFSRVIFVENELNIKDKCNLYFEVGQRWQIIHLRVNINDMVEFLDEWHKMKKLTKEKL